MGRRRDLDNTYLLNSDLLCILMEVCHDSAGRDAHFADRQVLVQGQEIEAGSWQAAKLGRLGAGRVD